MQANKPNKQVDRTERKITVLTIFFELAYYQGKDIEFRFNIAYSSLRDFGPY
jgi:hypothetical protein